MMLATRTGLLALFVLGVASPAIARDEAPKAVTVKELARTTTSWDGVDLPRYPQGTPEITILKYTIPGNTILPWHRHPVINAGYMLSGRLKVVTRTGETLQLSAGETITETVHTWHQGINEHPEPVEILVFYAGAVGEELVEKEE
ncbi:cupin domain-containing protein [Marinihelvus fidelis]|uniref:Cupin domain-containing protein n=1 Tax=Marinihelvus fidelis TaxID=2613842 RepID=A0A5N0T447_9GAMM|nr:cupin domain-containing protein [Marinihelvus fidelis]KAA9129632.1 cupin domain-containing protein [Marinihelvus fidelis]